MINYKFHKLGLGLCLLFLVKISFAYRPILKSSTFVDSSLIFNSKIQKELAEVSSTKVYQLFIHGRTRELFLNRRWSNGLKIEAFLKPQISQGITHLNIYGCEFAKGKKGLAAVNYLEKYLGISVSTFTNTIGKERLISL